MTKILFCLRHRDSLWGSTGSELSSGLYNSVRFLTEMLWDSGIDAHLVQLADHNKIDAAIHRFRPDLCILEALWVLPSKVAQLQRLHSKVQFAVRLHSEIPFISMEGMACAWIYDYLAQGVEIMVNSPRALTDIQRMAAAFGDNLAPPVSYMPNYYPVGPEPPVNIDRRHPQDDDLRIICAGSIRPLKNQLMQALCAIAYANQVGKPLQFFVNATRVEGSGQPILTNLRALFAKASNAKLVEVAWLEHPEFLQLMASMDASMQCSLSETFNICSADAVHQNVVVVASDIPWLGAYGTADAVVSQSIIDNLADSQTRKAERRIWQWRDLFQYSDRSLKLWTERFA